MNNPFNRDVVKQRPSSQTLGLYVRPSHQRPSRVRLWALSRRGSQGRCCRSISGSDSNNASCSCAYPRSARPRAGGGATAGRASRPNIGLEPTPYSFRSYVVSVCSADAARRQEAGAASCLAFPHCDQRHIRGRVTPRTDHRAVDRAPAPRCAAGVAGARALPAP
jgi:hypothetical protein